MPIYEYICQDCGQEFDKMRSFNDADAPIECKNCHSIHAKRKLSVFFAQSDGKAITTSSAGCGGGCGGCSGGSCGSCSH